MSNLSHNHFCDDYYFHYLLTHSSLVRNMFCQKLVGEKHKLVSTTVEDPIVDEAFKDHKRNIVDVLAIDDKGNKYDIEMQCYPIDEENINRFQLYAYRILSLSVKAGENYKHTKPVYQLIINASNKDMSHFHHYEHIFKLSDIHHENQSIEPCLYTIDLIQLHHIDELSDIHSESEFNKAMYIFKNGAENDIISSSKPIEEMVTMFHDYISAEDYKEIIMEREIAWENTLKLKAKEEGLAEGLAEGRVEGLAKGRAEGRAEGLVEGKKEGMVENLKSLMQRLNCDINYAMDLLNVDESRRNEYKALLENK